jgi:hypothetical protein
MQQSVLLVLGYDLFAREMMELWEFVIGLCRLSYGYARKGSDDVGHVLCGAAAKACCVIG